MGRTFNTSQRVDLYIQAEGHCEECGAELEPGWHADHKIPYSAGGPTQLWNGQALCPKCNLQKGVNFKMRIPEWSIPLRPWQKEVYGAWFDHSMPNFLMVGTPGCGKTIAALKIVHSELQSGRIERVIIVVPSVHLCEQWADAANTIGIHLDPYFENSTGAIASDMDGIVVTYQQVASQPELFRLLATQVATGHSFEYYHVFHCAHYHYLHCQ